MSIGHFLQKYINMKDPEFEIQIMLCFQPASLAHGIPPPFHVIGECSYYRDLLSLENSMPVLWPEHWPGNNCKQNCFIVGDSSFD